MGKKFLFYEGTRFKDTEIGPIPEDWEVVRLGEVFNIKQGKQLSTKEKRDGKILKPFLRTSNVLWNKIDISNLSFMYFTREEFENLKLTKGDILVCEGGDVGRSAVFDIDFDELAYQNHLHRLRPIGNYSIINYFFTYFFEFAITQKKAYLYEANRTTIPNLSAARLKQFLIPLPPLPEQKAIAEVLSIVQDAIEKTEGVIKATKELKKSMMKHLFTYGPVGIDEVNKVKLKKTEIGFIPEDWKVVRLGDKTQKDVKLKGIKISIKNLRSPTLVPFIPMSMIPEDSVYITKWEMKYNTEIKSGIPIFEKDLLLAKITPCFENGKQGIIKGLPNGYGYSTTEVIPIRVDESVLLSEYIAYYLHLPPIRHFLASKMEGTTGRKRLPKSQIENLLIPLPPLPVQQKIAEILSAIDEKIQAEENKKKALENLFKTLLNNLMTGKIRVNPLGGEDG